MTGPEAPLYDFADGPPGGRAFWTTTRDNTRIRAALWPADGGRTALVLPGRTEHIEKYGLTAARLVSRGFNTVVIDWRGQGLSDRHPQVGNLGHVNSFKDFQLDLQAVMDIPEVRDLPAPRTLFCHSMGGCIGLRSLIDGLDVDRAIFSAPMWGFDLSWFNYTVAVALSKIANRTGQSTKMAPLQGAEPYILAHSPEGNILTTDLDTYRWFRRHLEERPELALAGTTFGWLGAAMHEMRELANADPPTLPVLALLGTEESLVSPRAIRRQIKRMPSAELMLVEGARHEIWMESEAKQAAVWQRIDSFLEID